MSLYFLEKIVPELLGNGNGYFKKKKAPQKSIICFSTCYIKLQSVRIWVVYYLVYLNSVTKKYYGRSLLYFNLCKYLAFKMVLIFWKILWNSNIENVFLNKLWEWLYSYRSRICKAVKFLFTKVAFNHYYSLVCFVILCIIERLINQKESYPQFLWTSIYFEQEWKHLKHNFGNVTVWNKVILIMKC